MSNELPTIAASQYTSRTLPLAAFAADAFRGNIIGALSGQALVDHNDRLAEQLMQNAGRDAANRLRQRGLIMPRSAHHDRDPFFDEAAGEENTMPASRRLVKVVIVDPNESIPLDQCLIYSGEEKLTDATDTELFYDVDIKTLLAQHNEKRVKLRDKSVKDRVEMLEPAKIRDLKMVVVNIAAF